MKKSKTNHELINELNNVMNSTHDINSTMEYLQTLNKQLYYDKIFSDSKFYPSKTYNSVNDFITDNYICITKGIVKKLALKCNVAFCFEIVNKNYNDNIFEDLAQEVAIILLENKDKIIVNNDNTYDLQNVILSCFRTVNNYGYKNKTRVDNTQVSIIGYDEESNNDISIAINTRSYLDYCSNVAYNDMFIDNSYKHFITIIRVVKSYIELTQKPFISEKCQNVLNLLIKGYKKKDIAIELDISVNSVTKYHNIIKDAFYNCYKKPHNKKSETTHNTDIKHNTMVIDYIENAMYNAMVKYGYYHNTDNTDNTKVIPYGITTQDYYKKSKWIKQENVISQRMDSYIY